MVKRKKKVKETPAIGAISEAENQDAGKFMFKHQAKCGKTNFRIKIKSVNGIGASVEVICRTCGKKKKITDVSSW